MKQSSSNSKYVNLQKKATILHTSGQSGLCNKYSNSQDFGKSNANTDQMCNDFTLAGQDCDQ